MKKSSVSEFTGPRSSTNDPLTIEKLEEIFDALFEGLPAEGVLTDDEVAAYRKAGFVSVTRGNRWIIYVDPDRLGQFTH